MRCVDPNHVRVLHDDVRPSRVGLKLVVLAIEYQRYRVVPVQVVNLVVRETRCAGRIPPPVWFVRCVPEEEVLA